MQDKIQDKRKRLYDGLVAAGYDAGADFKDFNNLMDSDEVARQWVYDTAKSEGWNVGESFDQFVGYITPTPQNTFTAQQLGLKEEAPQKGDNAWDTYKDVGAVKPAVQSGEKETLTTFGEGVKQGADAIYQGNKYFAGEQARFWNGAQQDAKKALEFLDAQGEDFDAKGWDVRKAMDEVAQKQWEKDYAEFLKVKEARRKERKAGNMGMWERILHKAADPSMPEPLEARRINPTNMSYQRPLLTLNDALKEADGDVVKAREILEKKASEEQWADKTMREASEAMAKHKPVEGAAWWGQMVPQVAGQATAIASNFVPYVGGFLGKALSYGTTAGLTASSAGQAMAEARRAGASDDEVWSAGVAQAVIEAGSEQIPLNRLIGKTGSAAFKKGYKAVADNIPEKELEKLLVEGNKRLGGKLLSGKTAKELVKDMGVEGASEFVAEFLGTYVPIIYADKESYPTLLEAVKNGWEGAKAGFAMGGFLGGGSTALSNTLHENRRKKQGFVELANDKDGNVVEVVGEKEGLVTVLTQDGATRDYTPEELSNIGTFSYDEWKNAKVDAESRNIKNAFDKGFNEPGVDTGDKLFTAEQEAKTALGLNTEESIEDFMGERTVDEVVMGDEDLKNKLNAYFKAKAEDEGRRERFEMEKRTRYAEVDKSIDNTANKDDGNIYRTKTLDGVEIFITGGKVVLNNEGYIDVNRSRDLIALFPDNSKKAIEAGNIREKIEVSNAQEAKDARHAEIDAEIDAELSAPKNAFSVNAEDGAHTIEVVEDNGNGFFTIVDNGEQKIIDGAFLYEISGGQFGKPAEGVASVASENAQPVTDNVQTTVEPIPTETRGKVKRTAYHVVPIERTLEDLENNELTEDEKIQFTQANIDEINSELQKVLKQEPKMGADIQAYKAAKAQWTVARDEWQKRFDYYNELLNRLKQPVQTSEVAPAVEGVAPQATNEMQPIEQAPIDNTAMEVAQETQNMQPVQETVAENQSGENNEMVEPVGNSEQLTNDVKTEDVNQSENNLEMVAEGENAPLAEISNDERAEMEARIVDWLSEGNLERAEGKTREEIFDEFGNELEPIAYIPKQYISLVSADLKDQRIYCGKGYFIDHALRNHAKDGKQLNVEDVDVSKYLNIQSVLDNPDSVKETYVDGKRTVVFIKKIGRYFAELTQVEEDGKIVLHKSMFNQKKEPYAKLNDIRSKGTSSEGGVSSISHTADAAPAISLESRGDVVSNSTVSSVSEDRNIVSNEQENTQKSDENAENGGEITETTANPTDSEPDSATPSNEDELDIYLAELKAQQERQKTIFPKLPKPSSFVEAYASNDTEAINKLDKQLDDALQMLVPMDITMVEATIKGMKDSKSIIKAGSANERKETPAYKAYDHIEKALAKRKKQLEKKLSEDEKRKVDIIKRGNRGEWHEIPQPKQENKPVESEPIKDEAPVTSEPAEQPETNEVANAGPVNVETLQLNMSDEDFNALLNGGDKTAISEYLAEMDGLLRIGVGSPLDGQEALREEYRKAVEQYGKENIPAEVMDDLNSRMQPYSDLSRAIFDRKYALQDKLREIEASEAQANEQAEKEAKAERKKTAFGGFLAGKTDLGAGSAEKALSKKYNFDGKVMTVAEFVEDAVGNGNVKLSAIEEPKYKGASRAAWNRMDARQQEADAKRVKESGTKTVYTVNDHDLGKTAYDYAKFLLDKKAEQEKADAKKAVEDVIKPFAKEKREETKPATEKIEDVGEKIGGAKKDRFAEGMARIKAELEETDETLMDKLAKLPVSQVFNFDLEKLREGGISNEAISFIKIVKDYLPAKPRKTYKIRNWVNNTLALYKLCLEAGTNWDRVNTLLNGPQFTSSSLKEQFDAYMAIGGFDSGMNIGNAKLKQLDKTSGRYNEDGKFVTLEGKWYVRDAGKHGGIYDTKEEAVNALKAFAGDKAGVTSSGKKKEVKFAVYQRRQDKSIFIAVKGKSDIVIQDGFKSSKEAFDYIETNNAELQERYRALLDKTNADFEDNRPREGRDYRDGKDIPAEEFRNTFGFRGVEFGNWMTQEDRRKALNECYDALMDLAAVCKVSPKALSLGGTLGMAFGARGGGKFSAHYESGKVVINLTKTKGAGSLAHEWFHALDNYFAKMGSEGLDVYATAGEGLFPEGISSIGKRYYDRKSGQMLTEEEYNERMNSHEVRREMADAWKSLMETLKKSDYYKRSAAYAGLHNSNYWARPTELGARAFSTWVENELSKQGASNDYLANNPRFLVSEATNEQSRFMPYPFDADATWMEEAFGNLFEVMQEKVDEDENAVLYRTAEDEVYTLEEQEIIDKAKADGTYMKAPNGKPSKLSPKQWAQVRTENFKKWFGDWEKVARIEKLKSSEPVDVEFKNEYELNRDSAKQWMKDNLRGEYTNADTGESITISKVGINEVTSHGSKDDAHLISLKAVPQFIENSVFIEEVPNAKGNDKYDSYRYYVCGARIKGEDYTVKVVIGVKGDSKFYDHRLTQIEKGALIDNLNGLSNSVAENQNTSLVGKDSKLISILQTNSSKIVDENGEPMVVYHRTPNEFTTFDPAMIGTSTDAGAFGNGFYLSPADFGSLYGKNLMPLFVNMKNPLMLNDANAFDIKEPFFGEDYLWGKEQAEKFSAWVKEKGYDGVWYENNGRDEIVATEPNQIKSATKNTGEFSEENNDIHSRSGAGPLTDREVVMDSDPYSKALGRPRYAGKKMGEYVARQRMEMAKRVKALAQKLNLNIDVLESTEGLFGKRAKAKGWYEPKGKRIVVVIPNHTSVNDAVATVLHEAVAHHGLRELFGENFDTFLQNVYNNADADVREAIETHAAQRYNGNLLTATEEHLASLAENTDFEYATKSGWWERIKDYFFKMLRGLGIEGFGGITLTDNELRYILWRSYQNLANPGMYNNVFGRVKDTAKQYELKVGDYAPAVQNGSMVAGEDIDNSYTELSYEEAVQIADDFAKTFKGAAKNVVISRGKDALEQQMREAGFLEVSIKTALENYNEDRKLPLGGYLGKSDGIVVYKYTTDEDLYKTLWHENTHRAIKKIYGTVPAILQTRFDELPARIKDKVVKELAAAGYKKNEFAEEAVCYFVGGLPKAIGYLKNGKNDVVNYFRTYEKEFKRFVNFAQGLIDYTVYGQGEITGDSTDGLFREMGGGSAQTTRSGDAVYQRNAENDGERRGTLETTADDTRFRIEENSIDNVPTQPLTFTEKITNSVLEASARNKENLTQRSEALRAYGSNLANVLKLMQAQRVYDKSTVDTLMKMAKMYFKNAQLLGHITPYEAGRIMSVLHGAVGKRDVTNDANKLVGILVDAHSKELQGLLDKAAKTKAKKVNASGVEVMGSLDKMGQIALEAYNEAVDLDEKAIEDKLYEAQNDTAHPEEAEARINGLMMAREYVTDIKQKKQEIKDLQASLKEKAKDAREGNMSRRAWKEFKKAIVEAIMEDKLGVIDAYHSLIYRMSTDISKASARAKAFQKSVIDHTREIQHFANSDMQGRSASAQGELPTKYNNAVLRGLMSGAPTFQYMLKKFGEKDVDGKGYLYDYFMGAVTKAKDKEFNGKLGNTLLMEAKLEELFGKKMKIADLYKYMRADGTTLTYREGGEMREMEISQGQMLYIYMLNKMADGRMKLSGMGITGDVVAKMAEELPKELVAFADWVQDDFLTKLREKYNIVHERMFGAPMAAIENYFPIKVNKRSIGSKEDISKDIENDKLSTMTGAIIKRKKNAAPIDLSVDALSALLDHINEMEHWSAFAEFNRDVNTLVNYNHFKNQVMNMSSFRYGSGKTLWENFRKTAQVVSGTYRPEQNTIDKAVLNISKGVTASKIAFRGYTAVKQVLSAPAFWSEASVDNLLFCYVNPKDSCEWAMEFLPGFKERWMGRMMGNEKLLPQDSDWKIWRNNFVKNATRIGMTPNAAVDALTVAQGARAVYLTKLEAYKKAGYTEQRANEKALQAAAEAYNESQQSSMGAYISPIQASGTAMTSLLTTFKNANFGYTRKTAQSLANIKRHTEKGYKEEAIAYMTKKFMREGLTEEQAKKLAERRYKRSVYRDSANVALFGFGLNMLWMLGGSAIYLLAGDDDEKKEELVNEALIRGALGSLDGIPLGETLANWATASMMGEDAQLRMPRLIAVNDFENIVQIMKSDRVRGAYELANMFIAMGIGVNPTTFVDAFMAFADVEEWSAEEVAMLALKILNAPKSQLEQLEVDKAMANGGVDATEVMRRYVEQRTRKQAPGLQGLYSDENLQKVWTKNAKRFDRFLDERLENVIEDDFAFRMFYDDADAMTRAKISEMREKYLKGDDKAFVKKELEDVINGVYFGAEKKTVYYGLANEDDLNEDFELKQMIALLSPVYSEYLKMKDGLQKGNFFNEHKDEIVLYKNLNARKSKMDSMKKYMQDNPGLAEKNMREIRKLRTEAMNLISGYNE